MKQKYLIQKRNDKNQMVISEYSELDKGSFSLVYKETYDGAALKNIIKDAPDLLVSTLRTPRFYPPWPHTEKIAESVKNLYESDSEESVEILINDREVLLANIKPVEGIIQDAQETVVIDELLDDDTAIPNDESDNHIDEDEIKINSSIKVAEDDSLDTDEQE